VGAALDHPLDEVLEGADPAAGDDRHPDRIGHGPGESEVEAVLRAVTVHGGEQDLAGAPALRLHHPVDGVPAGGCAPAVDEDLEAAVVAAPGVDGHDHALTAELVGEL